MIALRSLGFTIWFYFITTLLCLTSPWARWRARRRGRAAILAYARLWARLVLGGLRVICGIGWRVDGGEHLPKPGEAAILAAQHQSTFETLLWTLLLPDVAFVVKRELFAVPIFGGLLAAADMIRVDRDGGAAALRGLLRETAVAAGQGRPIVIFPEGTRSPAGQVGALRPGFALAAERTRLAIIPITTDSGRFWGRDRRRRPPGTIRVTVLPALPAELTRARILQRLEQLYRCGEPVENSVGGLGEGLSRGQKQGL